MDPKRFTRRLIALGAAMFFCALVFVVTLFDAQIVNGDDYLAQSIRTNAKSETVKASRGVITDRNGKVLVSNRAVYTLNFDSSLVSSDELNDALLRVIDLMNAQGVEIKDTLPLARTSPYAYDTANGSAKTLVKYLVSLKWINEKNVGDNGLPTTLTGSALYLKLRSEYGIDETAPEFHGAHAHWAALLPRLRQDERLHDLRICERRGCFAHFPHQGWQLCRRAGGHLVRARL